MKLFMKKHWKMLICVVICFVVSVAYVIIINSNKSIISEIQTAITVDEFKEYLASNKLSYETTSFTDAEFRKYIEKMNVSKEISNLGQVLKIKITDIIKFKDFEMEAEAFFNESGRLIKLYIEAYTLNWTNPNACGPQNYNYPLFKYIQKLSCTELVHSGFDVYDTKHFFVINDTKDCFTWIRVAAVGGRRYDKNRYAEEFLIDMDIISDANNRNEDIKILGEHGRYEFADEDYREKSPFLNAHK